MPQSPPAPTPLNRARSNHSPTPTKLTVVHVSSGDVVGGAETMLVGLLRQQGGQPGVTAELITFNDGFLAKAARDVGCRVTVVDETQHGALGLCRGIMKVYRRARPDVIHTHGYKENTLACMAAVASRTRAAVVRTFHGAPEFSESSGLRVRLISSADRLVTRRFVDALVAVSDELRAALPSLGYGSANTQTIFNGVEHPTELESDADAGSQPPGPRPRRLVYVGRLVALKRVDLILQAFAAYRQRAAANLTAELIVIGDGPERAKLEALAKELELGASCMFRGVVSNPKPLVKSSDALILASEHEGTPMCILEALSLGVPVIAPRVGGITPQLVTARSGVLLDTTTVSTLAEAIAEVLGRRADFSPGLPMDYTAEQMAKRYLHLYEEYMCKLQSGRPPPETRAHC